MKGDGDSIKSHRLTTLQYQLRETSFQLLVRIVQQIPQIIQTIAVVFGYSSEVQGKSQLLQIPGIQNA